MKKLIVKVIFYGLIAALSINIGIARSLTSNLAKQPEIAEHAVGSCRFKIANMFGGRFETLSQSSPAQGGYLLPITGPKAFLTDGFSLFCVEASVENIASSLNGKYVDGRWWTYGPVDGPEFVPYERQAKAQTIRLNERNWTGIAYAEDATTGEERKRARIFHFCLVHGANALCGYAPVKWMSERKGRNDVERVKAILETVEFVDGPGSTDASPTGVAPVNK
jgi:hypothetical protein